MISSAEPEFTKEARKAQVSGSVMISFYVLPTGRPEDIWLVKPFGFGMDENAMRAVRQYVFKPARYDGRPVGIELSVLVNFETVN